MEVPRAIKPGTIIHASVSSESCLWVLQGATWCSVGWSCHGLSSLGPSYMLLCRGRAISGCYLELYHAVRALDRVLPHCKVPGYISGITITHASVKLRGCPRSFAWQSVMPLCMCELSPGARGSVPGQSTKPLCMCELSPGARGGVPGQGTMPLCMYELSPGATWGSPVHRYREAAYGLADHDTSLHELESCLWILVGATKCRVQ